RHVAGARARVEEACDTDVPTGVRGDGRGGVVHWAANRLDPEHVAVAVQFADVDVAKPGCNTAVGSACVRPESAGAVEGPRGVDIAAAIHRDALRVAEAGGVTQRRRPEEVAVGIHLGHVVGSIGGVQGRGPEGGGATEVARDVIVAGRIRGAYLLERSERTCTAVGDRPAGRQQGAV